MLHKTFNSFAEARDYSKKVAIERKIVLQISRNGVYWEVFPLSKRKEYQALKEKGLLIKEKNQALDELNQERKELEILQQQNEELAEAVVIKVEKEAKDRRKYLRTKYEYFKNLEKDALQDLWENEKDTLLKDEKKVLRDVLRSRLNINTQPNVRPGYCKQCGMVGSNCTCSRSWF